jgi:predicted lipid-binding transport protein (Tim44 family)
MSGQLDVTAILFLIVAVVVFLKLRSVLGRRTEDDEARIERYRSQRAAQQQQAQKPQSDGKVVTLPRRPAEEGPRPEPAPVESDIERDARILKFAGENKPLGQGLVAIAKQDRGFDPAEFMNGAKAAYEMIVMAFAEGNRALLKDLLSPDVFTGFEQAIKAREMARETVEQSFVGIALADMIEAEMSGRNAQVTVKFVSELISAIRSGDGAVISGDPKKIKEVTDIWTFARDTGSRDPNWRLVATQAAN